MLQFARISSDTISLSMHSCSVSIQQFSKISWTGIENKKKFQRNTLFEKKSVFKKNFMQKEWPIYYKFTIRAQKQECPYCVHLGQYKLNALQQYSYLEYSCTELIITIQMSKFTNCIIRFTHYDDVQRFSDYYQLKEGKCYIVIDIAQIIWPRGT